VKEIFEGVFIIDDMLATMNLTPGMSVYDERLVSDDDDEYRLWNPSRSKLSAALVNGLTSLPMEGGSRVLYLGAASGTTASHVSDLVGEGGVVFCVESSPSPMKKLIEVCKSRGNMVPIFADANHPETYYSFLEHVEVVYQDIAQRNQAEILLKNSALYLDAGGHVLLNIKARSIDSTKGVANVTSDEIAKLKPEFKIEEVVDLKPYEKDHSLVLAKKL
jgi:fibrillarin-like pre-rRNA processing protein